MRFQPLLIGLCLVSTGCAFITQGEYDSRLALYGDEETDTDSETDTGNPSNNDVDGDGIVAALDCDDEDPKVGGPEDFYEDADGDGWGNPDESIRACEAPSGHVAEHKDCDDTDANINPNATEVCDDNDVDEDCNFMADDDDPGVTGVLTWYHDIDGDGVGGTSTSTGCEAPANHVADTGDCNDRNDSIYPGAPEYNDGVDSNCDNQDWVCGSTIYRVPTDHNTVQAAVDAACTGDTVTIAAGAYTENVNLGSKDLVLEGLGVSGSSQLVGNSSAAALTMQTGTVRNLSLTGGQYNDGHGLEAINGTTITLIDVRVYNNDAVTGAGIYLSKTNLVCIDSVIEDNYGLGQGGGIYAFQSGLDLDNCTIRNNTAVTGGGIYVEDAPAPVTITNSQFAGNTATGNGGGLYDTGSFSLSVTDTTFVRNSAGNNGGGAYLDDVQGAFRNVEVLESTANQGSGLWVLAGASPSWQLMDSTIEQSSGAAALYLEGKTGTNLSRVRVRDNTSNPAVNIKFTATASNLEIIDNAGAGLQISPTATGNAVALTNSTVVGNNGAGITLLIAQQDWASVTNVISAFNNGHGIIGSGTTFPHNVSFSDFHGNSLGAYNNISDPVGSMGNVDTDPVFQTFHEDLDSALWDLHLAPSSPIINAGATAILDGDGSASDMGAFGGPGADASWWEDVDSDGMNDGWEILHGLDATVDDSAADPDSDGRTNVQEFVVGTWPEMADTDGDGTNDGSDSAPLDPGSS